MECVSFRPMWPEVACDGQLMDNISTGLFQHSLTYFHKHFFGLQMHCQKQTKTRIMKTHNALVSRQTPFQGEEKIQQVCVSLLEIHQLKSLHLYIVKSNLEKHIMKIHTF